MIEVSDDVKAGDRVFAWYSFKFEKEPRKTCPEVEYRLSEIKKDHIKLESLEGNYSVIFGKELIQSWFGKVRKAN